LSPYFYSYLKNSSGKDTDGITFQLELLEHIPEWLPIQGQKIRIFYYGMKRQCNACWEIGHPKWQCKGKKTNWRGYVDQMIASGWFAPSMYGKWHKKPEQKNATQDQDLRAMLDDPVKLKKMVEFFNVMSGSSKPQTNNWKGDGYRGREKEKEGEKGKDDRKSSPRKKFSPKKRFVAKKRSNQETNQDQQNKKKK